MPSKTKKPKKPTTPYPRCAELGIPVDENGYILSDDLDRIIIEKWGEEGRARFSTLFGIQTCPMIGSAETGYRHGLYAWDTEAVLERMRTGALTGTQLFWD